MARPSWQSPTAASTPGPCPGQGPAGTSRLAPSPVRPWAQAGAHRVPPPGLLLLMAQPDLDIPDAAAGGGPEEAGEPRNRVTETRTVTSRQRGGDLLTQRAGEHFLEDVGLEAGEEVLQCLRVRSDGSPGRKDRL